MLDKPATSLKEKQLILGHGPNCQHFSINDIIGFQQN